MNETLLLASVGAALLAAVHIVTPLLRFLGGTPRSIWLSIAGGVSVAYVFVHLLPELAEGQEHVSQAVHAAQTRHARGGPTLTDLVLGLGYAERHVYLIALAGLALFYGLDKLAKRSRGQQPPADGGTRASSDEGRQPGTAEVSTSPAVFWIHMASFGIYNALIGYLLLHREAPGLASLGYFVVAMALHFLVTDFALNEDHKRRYRSIGRWLLSVSLGVGLLLGAKTQLSAATIAVLVAFLAGGVILNVLKEEVPSERQSRFWAFGMGLVAYAVLLLAF